MHELGHNLGLDHGGSDEVNYKPNYFSVMNYLFAVCDVTSQPFAGLPGGCDYSRFDFPDLTETLPPGPDEWAGIDDGMLGLGPNDGNGNTFLEGVSCPVPCLAPNLNSNVQFEINRDDKCVTAGANFKLESGAHTDDLSVSDASGQMMIVDGPNFTCNSPKSGDDKQEKEVGKKQKTLKGLHDWSHLKFNFRDTELAEVVDEVGYDFDVIEKERRVFAKRVEPDIVVEKSGPVETFPGLDLTYKI